MPTLLNKSVDDAKSAITALGLTVGSVVTTSSPTIPSGAVISQEPAAGADAVAGSAVSLVVSSGKPLTAVPDVSGKTRDEAFVLLVVKGFMPEQIEGVDASPKGQVFGQLPPGGTPASEGATVVVAVSTGPQTQGTKMPNVTGKKQAQAIQMLRDAGFVPIALREPVSGAPKGSVSAQLPAAGTVIAQGTEVAVAVSMGTITLPDATVPNVVGKQKADAANALAAAGLVATPMSIYTGAAPVGRVIAQDPADGAKLALGSEVAVLVSAGAGSGPMIKVPSLATKPQSAAVSAVKRVGLYPIVIKDYSDTTPAGLVISQLPAALTKAPAGSVVGIMVSLGPRGSTIAKVPGVVKLSRAAAEKRITEAGFVPYTIVMPTLNTAKGLVAAQLPTAGSKARKGSQVAIIVSQGRVSVTAKTPSVVGLTEAQAKKTLLSAGLIPVSLPVASSTARGKVVSQVPRAGKYVLLGSEVAISVSMGPEVGTLPENLPY
jgi:beta-lactam-binding protein with PASTA domain